MSRGWHQQEGNQTEADRCHQRMKLNHRNDSWAKDDKHDFSVWREFTLKKDLKRKKKKKTFCFCLVAKKTRSHCSGGQRPPLRTEVAAVVSSFCFMSSLRHVLRNERLHFLQIKKRAAAAEIFSAQHEVSPRRKAGSESFEINAEICFHFSVLTLLQ